MKNTSKLIILVLLGLLTIFFYSCENTDNHGTIEESSSLQLQETESDEVESTEYFSEGLDIKVVETPLLHYVGTTLVCDGIVGHCEVTGVGNCTDTDIIIPPTYNGYPVTRITDTFQSDNIKSITVSKNVSSVCIKSCSNLISINVSPDNEFLKDIDGNLYTNDGKVLIRYASGKPDNLFEIPTCVVKIEEYAFSNSPNLQSVNIPTSVKEIGDRAFLNCSNLSNINIPSSKIGRWCFENCTALKTVSFNGSTIPFHAFDGCISMTSITLGKNVSYINEYAFENCSSLLSIDLSHITHLSNSAFRNCKNLKNVTLGDQITNIPENTFYGCTSLYDITIPENVKEISSSAFYGCTSLKNVTILRKKTSSNLDKLRINDQSFYGCTALESVTVPNAGLYSIGEEAFYNCINLKNVNINGQVDNIQRYAFANCKNLSNITMGTSYNEETTFNINADYIEEYAFSGCTKLTNLIIDSRKIEKYSFNECIGLKNINFYDIWTIESYAFNGCTKLEEVIFGSNVRIMGYAFNGCTRLSEVIFTETDVNPQVYANAFMKCNNITFTYYEYDNIKFILNFETGWDNGLKKYNMNCIYK